jgi:hypothetical protein
VRRFAVWRVPHPVIDLVEYPGLRTVEVHDSDGPRDAAVEWAHALDLSAETVVRVREVLAGPEGETEWGDVTRWRVEPVTTYRARPA